MSYSTTLPVFLPTISLLISNMHCTSCCETIDHLLSTISSIKSISTSLLLHSVTFSIDLESSGSSSTGKPKTIGKVIEEALKVLRSEGGFNVIAESANGYTLPSHLKEHSSCFGYTHGDDEEEIGWIGKLFLQGKKEKERNKLEDRRKKHLEHCKTCQDEIQNQGQRQDRGLNQLSEIQPNEGINLPLTNEKQPTYAGIYKTTLSIEGMTCASCVNSITASLKSNTSIISININLLGASGIIRHKADLSPQGLIDLVEDIGFEAQVIRSERETGLNDQSEEDNTPTSFKSVFSIEGMTCASCTGAITRSLEGQPGITSVHIDLLNNSGTIIHSAGTSVNQIKEMIEEVGYDAELSSSQPLNIDMSKGKGKETEKGPQIRNVQIKVDGMFCHDCVRKINLFLHSLQNKIETYTPLTLNSPITTISYIPYQPLTIRDLLHGISNISPEFEANIMKTQSLSERSKHIQKKEVKILASHCLVAIVFAIPTFIIAIVSMILLPEHNTFRMRMMEPIWGGANLGTLILWPLATVVQFGVGRLFYKRTFASMWPHLRRLVPSALRTETMRRLPPRPLSWRTLISFGSMDLLVVLSTTVSYFASLAMLILDIRATPGTDSVGTYFDSCVFLIMFILLGRTLEAYAKSRTTDAVSLLGKMRPESALLVQEDSASNVDDENNIERKKSQESQAVSFSYSEEPTQPEHTSQNITRKIPVDQLEIGDILLLQPGSLPPTDGIIVSGNTTFDESSLTGESKPIQKSIDSLIYTGTVNLTSVITMKVTNLAENTMLEKIIRAVSDASSRKAPLELMAEKLTGFFVPIIVYFSLTVLLIWLSLSLTNTVIKNHGEDDQGGGGGRVFFAIEFAIATLVVACPCGIGLAVPCANAVGNGLTAKNGILASGGGEAFLAATRISKIVFDKTGTLTLGKSVIIDQEWASSSNQNEEQNQSRIIEKAILEVERGSTHPLAIGLVEHLERQRSGDLNAVDSSFNHENAIESYGTVEIIETKEIAGRGLKATVRVTNQTINLLIGNVAHLEDHDIQIETKYEELVDKWSNEAKSVILVATSFVNPEPDAITEGDGIVKYELSAIFSLSDPPREESLSLIKNLREKGIQVTMLSGDNQSTALAVGKLLGLNENEVIGGVGPEGKAEHIRKMQEELKDKNPNDKKGLVMFVGDGLNDSVALAAADVSCAMRHGSQATLASADFVLLLSNLSSILTLIKISKKIILRQKLNLLWAISFNVVCLPFAAGVFYGINGIRLTPVWSAVLMALSSVSVVTSSLAMRWGI
ncbi:uncharacterized protein L201_003417 [Kwoniella dendrophila CBS 6074]|uniref:HMA domain-containing protein n=1 Tax=Kwoniella dendrophila CBS 6074 TaxID=1295534 RepID=A0AAX4JTI8_9TREE